MQQNNLTSLGSWLRQLPTEQLYEMLRTELEKDQPEKAAIQMLMDTLQQREQEQPTPLTPKEIAAAERYRQRQEQLEVSRKRLPTWVRLASAACLVVAVLAFGAFVPINANADSLFQMVFRWSDNFFEVSTSEVPEEKFVEYHFETDNPGLQQVYDAVVELGVDFPAVPMWLPDEYSFIECKRSVSSKFSGVSSKFTDNTSTIVIKIDVFGEEVSHEYYITNPNYEPHEYFGTTHYITRNYDQWVVIWSQEENIECFLTIDCSEETLHRIIQSIYVREDT